VRRRSSRIDPSQNRRDHNRRPYIRH
jgi:hypothetical protein